MNNGKEVKIIEKDVNETSPFVILNNIRPCIKYRNATNVEQMQKLMEEVREVDEACDNFSNDECGETFDNLTMEIADVIVCCTTFLDKLGLNTPAKRAIVYRKVYEKNDVRGYYKESKKKGK